MYRYIHRFIYLIFPILFLISCNDDYQGEINGLKLGNHFHTDLIDITIGQSIDDQVLADVSKYFINPLYNLQSLQIYNAKMEIKSNLEPIEIVLLKLKNDMFKESYLGLIIKQNKVVDRIRLWGNQLFDIDRNAAYENYYRQFDKKTFILNPKNYMKENELMSYLESLNNKETFLYKHKRFMINKNYLIRHTMAVTGLGKTPDIMWYQKQIDEFEELRLEIHLFEDELGKESTEKYQQEVDKSISNITKIIQNIKKENSPTEVRSMIKDLRSESCLNCHAIKSKNLNGTLKKLEIEKYKLGFRKDLFKPDIDIWSIPGEKEQTLFLTQTIKAIVIYFSLLNEKKEI